MFGRTSRSAIFRKACRLCCWRRGRDSIIAILAILLGFLHFRDNTLCFSSLQAIPILGYSFYSFSYSLEFRGKRYQRYQSETVASKRVSNVPEGHLSGLGMAKSAPAHADFSTKGFKANLGLARE
jgi:hypothetical protein